MAEVEEPQAAEASGSGVLFPLDLTLPNITLPSFELPTIEFLESDCEGDDVRVLHVDGHAVRLPSFLRLS